MGEPEEMMTERVQDFLARNPDLEPPFLVLDLDEVKKRYLALAAEMPFADIYYAVKANPARPILSLLAGLGSCFDCASPREVRDVLDLGVAPSRISYGNTIKKDADIRTVTDLGIDLFAFDCEEELEKLARLSPGARVFCRIVVDNTGADWPLSRKFGCAPEQAVDLMLMARDRGLVPYGLSFHVGSQQTNPESFDSAIATATGVMAALRAKDVHLQMLNLGGGLPAHYDRAIPELANYAAVIKAAMAKADLNGGLKQIIVEPGRYMVADAGMTVSEVVLTAQRGDQRWVYLDIGKFGGLAETIDEAIRYRFVTKHNGAATVPSVVAGPTCDSCDVLYEKNVCQLPAALKTGDRVHILSTGAYTTVYAAANFNGIPPLQEFYI